LARRVVEVLLEPESGDRDSPTRSKSWEDIAACDDEVAVFDLCYSGAFQPMTSGLCSSLKVSSPPAITKGTTSRALTPLECERLMGWPDNYTAHGFSDEGELVDIANTNRYRICGNGIVATVTEWIGHRLPTVTGSGDDETMTSSSNRSLAATSQT